MLPLYTHARNFQYFSTQIFANSRSLTYLILQPSVISRIFALAKYKYLRFLLKCPNYPREQKEYHVMPYIWLTGGHSKNVSRSIQSV